MGMGSGVGLHVDMTAYISSTITSSLIKNSAISKQKQRENENQVSLPVWIKTVESAVNAINIAAERWRSGAAAILSSQQLRRAPTVKLLCL